MQSDRHTVQRMTLLEELRAFRGHPTADELYAVTKRRIPSISLGTVYRNLEHFSESGQVRKLQLKGERMRFDPVLEKHYHLRCDHCGRIFDVYHKRVKELESLMLELDGDLEVKGYDLEFNGVCGDCKAGYIR